MTENPKPAPHTRTRRRTRTKKSHRAAFVGTAVVVLGAAVILALFALEDRVMFFYSPTDVAERGTPVGEDARVGGLVVEGSVLKEGSATVFAVTDLQHSITIAYGGILPDLFREGQGIVAEGTFAPTGRFEASRVLAKHDENYMPPEVADALKASGQWKNGPADPSYGDASYGNEGGS
ncbi:cytochrome c maturation protein CcmE [Pyruvatibacter sp.]|uniref:cytochrome c maturation protein CcmE n=1 Tax=Pyruvatibacter sp. TaxID=1981328 RepID=UPI0032EA9242